MASQVRRGVEYGRPMLQADAVPIDAATGDVAVFSVPVELATRGYRVTGFLVYGASGTPVLAQLALRNGPGGTGAALVAASVITALDSALKVLSMTIADGGKQTSTSIYLNLAVANIGAVTVSAKILYEPL